MTLREVYQLGKKQAQSGEIGAYCTDFDVLCLFEHCFGRDRPVSYTHLKSWRRGIRWIGSTLISAILGPRQSIISAG